MQPAAKPKLTPHYTSTTQCHSLHCWVLLRHVASGFSYAYNITCIFRQTASRMPCMTDLQEEEACEPLISPCCTKAKLLACVKPSGDRQTALSLFDTERCYTAAETAQYTIIHCSTHSGTTQPYFSIATPCTQLHRSPWGRSLPRQQKSLAAQIAMLSAMSAPVHMQSFNHDQHTACAPLQLKQQIWMMIQKIGIKLFLDLSDHTVHITGFQLLTQRMEKHVLLCMWQLLLPGSLRATACSPISLACICLAM